MTNSAPSQPCATLEGARHISLTTFRKNGVGVATPVWFAEVVGGVVIFTQPQAGKVKRIRHNAQVTLAPCTANGAIMGPTLVATAAVLVDLRARHEADRAITRKYGLPFGIFRNFLAVRRWLCGAGREQHVYIAITLTA